MRSRYLVGFHPEISAPLQFDSPCRLAKADLNRNQYARDGVGLSLRDTNNRSTMLTVPMSDVFVSMASLCFVPCCCRFTGIHWACRQVIGLLAVQPTLDGSLRSPTFSFHFEFAVDDQHGITY